MILENLTLGPTRSKDLKTRFLPKKSKTSFLSLYCMLLQLSAKKKKKKSRKPRFGLILAQQLADSLLKKNI